MDTRAHLKIMDNSSAFSNKILIMDRRDSTRSTSSLAEASTK